MSGMNFFNLTTGKAPYLNQFNRGQTWHEPTLGVILSFLATIGSKQICSGHGFKVRPIGTLHLVECRIAARKSFFSLINSHDVDN